MTAETEATIDRAPASGADDGAAGAAELLAIVLASLEDSKAEDLITISLAGKTSIGDFMVIASGRSNRHVGAIADRLLRALKDAGHGSCRIEGLPHCDWVLIDAGDVIIHIFQPEVRDFYNLEKMWSVASDRASA